MTTNSNSKTLPYYAKGISIETRQWVYGVGDDNDCTYIYTTIHNRVEIDPLTYSESTFILDTKGNPIFKNDLIQFKGSEYQVQLDKAVGYYLQNIYDTGDTHLLSNLSSKNLLIIGNILDRYIAPKIEYN